MSSFSRECPPELPTADSGSTVLDVVQPLEKEEVGKLLDGVHGVGKAAGPEFVPQLVYLRVKFGIGEQWVILSLVQWGNPPPSPWP